MPLWVVFILSCVVIVVALMLRFLGFPLLYVMFFFFFIYWNFFSLFYFFSSFYLFIIIFCNRCQKIYNDYFEKNLGTVKKMLRQQVQLKFKRTLKRNFVRDCPERRKGEGGQAKKSVHFEGS